VYLKTGKRFYIYTRICQRVWSVESTRCWTLIWRGWALLLLLHPLFLQFCSWFLTRLCCVMEAKPVVLLGKWRKLLICLLIAMFSESLPATMLPNRCIIFLCVFCFFLFLFFSKVSYGIVLYIWLNKSLHFLFHINTLGGVCQLTKKSFRFFNTKLNFKSLIPFYFLESWGLSLDFCWFSW